MIATQSILPIGFVIENNGRISLKELSDKLFEADQRRFRNLETVRGAIENHIACLDIVEEEVIYNKNSKSYTKEFQLVERSAQNYLHNKIPNMKEWELYEYKTRKNSNSCNMKIDWKNIPLDESPIEWFGLQPNCDFREQGNEYCTFSCNPDYNAAIGMIYGKYDDFSIIGELHSSLNRKFKPS
jgi:hypothetical protein